MKKSVAILLSTYNGADFLQEQIASIRGQEGVEVQILVRDDSSTDSTLHLLHKMKSEGILDYYLGDNIGPARSFMHLLAHAPEADYYAFSDQDDVWLPDKLSAAIQAIQPYGHQASLYLGQTQPTDRHLVELVYKSVKPFVTFGESLIYEFAAGCTMVFNKSLRELVLSYSPDYLSMHDVWIYSVALALGANVHFDPIPHILYRQHDNNAIGQSDRIFTTWSRRIRRFVHSEQSRSRRAKEIAKGFHEKMSPSERDALELFLEGKKSFRKRIQLLHDPRFLCGNASTSRWFRLALLLNSY